MVGGLGGLGVQPGGMGVATSCVMKELLGPIALKVHGHNVVIYYTDCAFSSRISALNCTVID